MSKNLKICISREPRSDGIVSCRSVKLRDRILRRLFGVKNKVLVLVPGDDVSGISITNAEEGGVSV